jgi:hypothetical protein
LQRPRGLERLANLVNEAATPAAVNGATPVSKGDLNLRIEMIAARVTCRANSTRALISFISVSVAAPTSRIGTPPAKVGAGLVVAETEAAQDSFFISETYVVAQDRIELAIP